MIENLLGQSNFEPGRSGKTRCCYDSRVLISHKSRTDLQLGHEHAGNDPGQDNRVPTRFEHQHQRSTTMNWDQVEGNWKIFKGRIKEKWGKRTDDELDQIA